MKPRAIAERPILFSGPMINAILAGRKTQTRRILTPQPVQDGSIGFGGEPAFYWKSSKLAAGYCHTDATALAKLAATACKYGSRGDRLWVRESWRCSAIPGAGGAVRIIYEADRESRRFEADVPPETWLSPTSAAAGGLVPSIYLPRWASRITLEIAGVRVERLQDISEHDILAEGVTVDRTAELTGTPWSSMPTLHDAWRVGWDWINGKRAPWASNPWVWVLDFPRLAAKEAPTT